MIFSDLINSKQPVIEKEFNKLLDKAWAKQTHIGNLLVWFNNGAFKEDVAEQNKTNQFKYSPYAIGLGEEGHSENLHYKFIIQYREIGLQKKELYSDYISQFDVKEYNKELNEKHTVLIEKEGTSIQLEMLIYLKFWEADLIIKKLYQFVRILNGEDYDWHFKVCNTNRDENCTGTRQDIIRKQIKNKIQPHSKIIFDLITDTYKTQIRNSIAHSKYWFLGRSIDLGNYIKEDPHSQIQGLRFNDWINIFHNTLILHNQYIRISNIIHNRYKDFAIKHNNEFPILILEKDKSPYEAILLYNERSNDWSYKQIKSDT